MENDTVWLTQAQMAELFQTDRTSIVRHISNIYKVAELDRESTCAKIAQVQIEGKRTVSRQIPYFNLDMIISVGYRVNAKTRCTIPSMGKQSSERVSCERLYRERPPPVEEFASLQFPCYIISLITNP